MSDYNWQRPVTVTLLSRDWIMLSNILAQTLNQPHECISRETFEDLKAKDEFEDDTITYEEFVEADREYDTDLRTLCVNLQSRIDLSTNFPGAMKRLFGKEHEFEP